MKKMLDSSNELHMPDLPEEIRDCLYGLCELAYNGLLGDRFVFDYKELCKTLPNPDAGKDIESSSLGLLNFVKNLSSSEESVHYQFLHLSIQEFLAAKYVADTLTGDKQLAFFIEHLKDVRFRLMLLFLAGLTKLNIPGLPDKIFHKQKLRLSTDLWSNDIDQNEFLFLGHMIFESRNTHHYSLLLQSLDDQVVLNLEQNKLTLFDCMIVAHFICSTNHSWKLLNLINCSLSSHSIDVFYEVCNEYTCNEITFEEVDLSHNNPDLLTNMVHMPWLSQTKRFKLNCTISLTEDSKVDLSCLAHIKTLSISVKIGQHICKCSLTDTDLYVKSHVTLFEPRFIDHMLQVNTTLKVLDLLDASINDTIAKGITAWLSKNSLLEILNVDNQKLSNSVTAEILSVANSHNTLCNLHLPGVQLSRAQKSWNLQPITRDKLLQFFSALNQSSMNIQLPPDLRVLRWTNITCSTAMTILQSLKHCDNLEELDLSENKQLVNESVISDILSAANSHNTLCHLQIPGVQLSRTQNTWKLQLRNRDELLEFFSALRQSSMNIQLPLSLHALKWEKITCSTALTILQSVEHFDNLEELDLSRNKQLTEGDSEAVGRAIERMLEVNTTLKALNLCWDSINDTIAKGIASGLAKNLSLKKVNMDNNRLSNSVVAEILTSANSHNKLCDLQLPYGVQLSRTLSGWKLQLRNRDELLEFFRALIQSSMNIQLPLSLHALKWENITCSTALTILQSVEHFDNLEELDLSRNKQLTEGDSEAVGRAIERMLEVNTTLKVLNLGGGTVDNAIANSIAAGLAKNLSLEKLNIGNNTLSDSVIAEILSSANSHNTLCHLQLSGVQLFRFQNTWDLHSDSVYVMPQFFCALNQSSMNIELPSLNFNRISITSTRVVIIFKSLEHNTAVKELELSMNKQITEGDSEAVGRAIERMLQVNTTLKVLDLHNGFINDTIVKGIIAGWTKNSSLEKLNIDSNTLSDRVIAENLSTANSHKSLCHLQVCGVQLLRTQSTESWKLQIMNENRMPQFFCALNQTSLNIKLPLLDLSQTNITSTRAVIVFQSLEQNTSLKDLDLSENKQLAEGDSKAVSHAIEKMFQVNTTLKVLDLHGGSINDTIAKGIVAGLTKNSSLEKLNVDSNTLSDSVVAEILKSANSHNSLCHLGLCGVQLLRTQNTWKLQIMNKDKKVPQFFCALYQSSINIKLPLLDLSKTNITSTRAVIILKSLEHDTSLKELDLSKNKQLAEADSKVVGYAIKRMLQVNTTLKVLDLHGGSVNDTIAKDILAGLTKNSSLEKLNVVSNTLSDSVIARILTSANSQNTLCHLQLCGVQLLRTQNGWKLQIMPGLLPQFFRALNQSSMKSTLPSLNLSTRPAVIIFQSLEYNTSFEELDLSEYGSIAGYSAYEEVSYAIKRMLLRNTTLKTLDLSNCFVLSSSKLVHLFKGLCHNTSLKKLNISGNSLYYESNSVAMAEMLSHNKSLTELDVRGCWSPYGTSVNNDIKLLAGPLLKNISLEKITVKLKESEVLLEEIERVKREENIDTSKWKLKIVGLRKEEIA